MISKGAHGARQRAADLVIEGEGPAKPIFGRGNRREAVVACPFRIWPSYAAVIGSIGSTIERSSFSGLLTRVEIGHVRIGSAGNGRIRSRGSGSSPSQRPY